MCTFNSTVLPSDIEMVPSSRLREFRDLVRVLLVDVLMFVFYRAYRLLIALNSVSCSANVGSVAK